MAREGMMGKGTMSFEKVGMKGYFWKYTVDKNMTVEQWQNTAEMNESMTFMVFAGVDNSKMASIRPYSHPLRFGTNLSSRQKGTKNLFFS